MKAKKFLLFLFLTVFFLAATPSATNAQCPMCKTSVESAMKTKGNNRGKGLNKGILYLLSMPYLAVGVVGTVWFYKSRKKNTRL